MQLKRSSHNDIVFEWIPYNQFDNVEVINIINKDNFIIVYSAIWKGGPLYYDYKNMEYIRISNKRLVLKCMYNPQNITNEFLNEVCNFFINLIYFLT
jgi:hypothetical protein